MTYTIKYSDDTDMVQVASMDKAVKYLTASYPNAEFGDAEQDGLRDEDDGQPIRRLVWASEDDADNDDGANAVASVHWTE